MLWCLVFFHYGPLYIGTGVYVTLCGMVIFFIATPRGLCVGIDFLFWRG